MLGENAKKSNDLVEQYINETRQLNVDNTSDLWQTFAGILLVCESQQAQIRQLHLLIENHLQLDNNTQK